MIPRIANLNPVTVVGWLIIAKAAFLAIPLLFLLIPGVRDEAGKSLQSESVSFAFSVAWACFGAGIRLVAGIALLRGMSSGRTLYCLYVPAAYLLTLYLYGFKVKDLVGLSVFAAFAVLLTRPSSAEFLRRGSSANTR